MIQKFTCAAQSASKNSKITFGKGCLDQFAVQKLPSVRAVRTSSPFIKSWNHGIMESLNFFVCLLLSATSLMAQEQETPRTKFVFTLEDVVQLAKEQSPQAIMARHRFRANYYSFVAYEATFLPKLTFVTNPVTWNQSIVSIQEYDAETGGMTIREAKANTFTSTAGLSLSQNIGLTGGSVALGSDFTRKQNFNQKNPDKATQYTTYPIRLSLYQPLNGYNAFTWLKKIEPLRYEEAKQSYLVQMESVSVEAVIRFFRLAIAQMNLKIVQMNYENSQKLLEIANGRFERGVIAENELLQMQLRYMQQESSLNRARIDIESYQYQLRSFLGFKDNVEIETVVDPEVPSLTIPYDRALDYALSRNPDIIAYNRQILEAEKDVAYSKSQKGVTLRLDASFGTNKTGYRFEDAYNRPDITEGVNAGITIPILDWSQARNRLRNAESLLEATKTQLEQSEADFKQNIYLQVVQFNMQKNQLRISSVSDTIAQKSYEISRQRYIMGKVSVTDLNIADSEKDAAKKNYMSELQTYWDYYFRIRRLTLFDFLNNKPIEEDFKKIIGE